MRWNRLIHTLGFVGPPAVRKTPNRVPCLDGLRAVSILLVCFSHACKTIFVQPGTIFIVRTVNPIGLLGVNVFFVISGYIITGC